MVVSRQWASTWRRFIPIRPGLQTRKTAGPAFIGAKFAINLGVWPYWLDQTAIDPTLCRWERACPRWA
ncbi:hypothetical protein EMIT0P176_330001 [Pseudomonas sp. IT-P176]